MENKDINTDYQKVRIGYMGPKVRNCKTYNWNLFEMFEIYIHYFLYQKFSSPT